MHATLVASQIVGLMMSASAGASPTAAGRSYVRIENGSAYIFADRRSYDDFDLAKCVNAVTRRRTDSARLRRAHARHRSVKLTWREHPNYFDRRGFGADYHLNWHFKSIPLNPLCESTTLLEIIAVR